MLLTNEQSRQLIDVGHVHAGGRRAQHELVRAYRYAPRWRTIGDRDYFYVGQQSKGVRSSQTEAAFLAYSQTREALQSRLSKASARLDEMAPVNVALRLGRVPKLSARILRAFDAEGLLGPHLRVIGTHALFGYEAAAGNFFQSELLATTDLDLCWDAAERLVILAEDGSEQTVLSILKRVDRSFDAGKLYGLSAVNDENFIVEIIAPRLEDCSPATGLAGDLGASPIPEVQSLIGDVFSAMAIGEDGLPVQIVCPLPDAFVDHKRMLSKANGRKPLQQRRDLAQAEAVAALTPVLNATGALYRETKSDGSA
jgi:hypothetical protein